MKKMAKQKQRVSFFTQGCRLNQAETATLEHQFEKAGFQLVSFKQAADISIINTCTVTENGDSDAKRLVNRVSQLNKNVKVALIGCMAQIQQNKLLKWPNVNWVVGNAEKMQLANLIINNQNSETFLQTPKMKKKPFTEPIQTFDRHHTRANLKVQDGCDFYCSFCVIPFARGPARSRFFYDCLAEAKELVRNGHKELVITGINVGTYQDQDKQLCDIIDALNDIKDLERIRISSIEPTTIPDRLIDQMADNKHKLCPYLHLPIQSGCDHTLKAMRRKYSLEEYCLFVEQVTHKIPDLCLGTDVIVGFPTERDQDFNTTYMTLSKLPFAYFHVFSYSERQLTLSRKHTEKVPPHTISKRSKQLRELSQSKKLSYQNRFIGKTIKVLIEQEKQGKWTGLSPHFCRVLIENNSLKKHQIVSCTVKENTVSGLIAELN